jgi:hypothetical protein
MTTSYRANFDKFLDTLTPEQMMFLGSLIEQDIQANGHANTDKLADLIYTRIGTADTAALHERTLKLFSDIV